MGINGSVSTSGTPQPGSIAYRINELVALHGVEGVTAMIKEDEKRQKETFTPSCGHVAYKSYHRQHKIYWCRHCNLLGAFTPYNIGHFAPFSSHDEALALQKEMRVELLAMLESIKSSPKHAAWVAQARAQGLID